ncbi:MAG: PDZ domain-containing protein [Deltaproteobacteria bacterium]|nr:PDZ domain-containing protein [Deltaproteobacteria bacterium]
MPSITIRKQALVALLSLVVATCAYEVRSTTLHSVAAPTPDLLSYRPKNTWSFRVLNGQVPPRKRSGLEWESDGTLPDPFVRLYVDERIIWESEVKYDTTSPQWNITLPRNVKVEPTSQFRIELWDFDTIASADPIGILKRRGWPPTVNPDAITRLMLDTGAVLTVTMFDPRVHEGVGIRSYEVRSDCLLVVDVEKYSPAGRAGIKPDECIVEIDGLRVSSLQDIKAMTMLSLAAKREYELKVADKGEAERSVKLDSGYIWLVM